ncbi:hypothetical protein [Yoonia sp.]|uniref:hypothetical protein n=1 Tax=Yoonia sp. TaxID=2212373 RepID=UPI0025F81F53|nr:hypothetical protein [Yoonia sp.]
MSKKQFFYAILFGFMTAQVAAAQDQPAKKTFAEQMAESVAEQLAEEEAQRLAIEAAKPTDDSIAAECDAQGDLWVRALSLNQKGIPLDEAKTMILESPEGIGQMLPAAAVYMVEVVYNYFSKRTPESLKARIVEQCLIR